MPSEASLANLKPPWPKGQTANVGGIKGYRRVLAMARRASPEMMQTMIDCARDKDASWRERVFAAAAIIDRAWGKAKEHITLDADGIHTLRIEFVDPRDGFTGNNPGPGRDEHKPNGSNGDARTINGDTFEISFTDVPDEDNAS